MEPEKTEQEAWTAFLSDELNVSCVEVDGGFVVVRRCCSNCEYYNTGKTKYCFSPSSAGCGQFNFNQKG